MKVDREKGRARSESWGNPIMKGEEDKPQKEVGSNSREWFPGCQV